MKQILLACLLGYFASAEDCSSEDETSSACYSELLAYETEMFRKLEIDAEMEKRWSLAQK